MTLDTTPPVHWAFSVGLLALCLCSCEPTPQSNTMIVEADREWPPPGWTQQNPITVETMQSVQFIDTNRGWVAGTNGTIFATQDGGLTWKSQTTGTDRHLQQVFFLNERQGWVVGENGTILHTEDGGQNWNRQDQVQGLDNKHPKVESLHLYTVHFVNPLRGWAKGQGPVETKIERGSRVDNVPVILTTNDGGRLWSLDGTSDEHNLKSFLFRTESFGWAVGGEQYGNGRILTTTDGGRSWSPAGTLPDNKRRAALFVDPLHGWAITNDRYKGTILVTKDGGRTWQHQFLAPRVLKKIVSPDGASLFAIGEYGTIVYSTDGGLNWSSLGGKKKIHYTDVFALDSRMAWVTGRSGLLLTTEDGGESWEAQMSVTKHDLHAASFVDARTGYAVGDAGTILKTVDGGEHWQALSSGVTDRLSDVAFASHLRGWVVGDKGTILATSDGGLTWKKQWDLSSTPFSSVFFLSPTQGWVVGDRDILSTTDGGKTWEPPFYEYAVDGPLEAVKFVDSKVGWAVGRSGEILRTRDGGKGWDRMRKRESKDYKRPVLADLAAVDERRAWAVGFRVLSMSSTILVTSDGGKTWRSQNGDYDNSPSLVEGLFGLVLCQYIACPQPSRSHPHREFLRGVWFLDSSKGWAVGERARILETTNGGWTWTTREPKVRHFSHRYRYINRPSLSAVVFVDESRGWIVGEKGTIIKTTTGGR